MSVSRTQPLFFLKNFLDLFCQEKFFALFCPVNFLAAYGNIASFLLAVLFCPVNFLAAYGKRHIPSFYLAAFSYPENFHFHVS